MTSPTARSAKAAARRPARARITTPWHLAQRCARVCGSEDDTSFALLVVELSPTTPEDGRIPEILHRGLRRGDLVAQFGENRYAVLLTGAGRYDAGRVASRIRLARPADIGVAIFPHDGANLAELVIAAHEVMDRAAQGAA